MAFKRGDWVQHGTGFFTNRAQVTGKRETQPNGRVSIALKLFWTNHAGVECHSEFWWYEDELIPLEPPEWDDSDVDDEPAYQQLNMFEGDYGRES